MGDRSDPPPPAGGGAPRTGGSSGYGQTKVSKRRVTIPSSMCGAAARASLDKLDVHLVRVDELQQAAASNSDWLSRVANTVVKNRRKGLIWLVCFFPINHNTHPSKIICNQL